MPQKLQEATIDIVVLVQALLDLEVEDLENNIYLKL
jgi:hypothetical protein